MVIVITKQCNLHTSSICIPCMCTKQSVNLGKAGRFHLKDSMTTGRLLLTIRLTKRFMSEVCVSLLFK
jgi:hypothetical protein